MRFFRVLLILFFYWITMFPAVTSTDAQTGKSEKTPVSVGEIAGLMSGLTELLQQGNGGPEAQKSAVDLIQMMDAALALMENRSHEQQGNKPSADKNNHSDNEKSSSGNEPSSSDDKSSESGKSESGGNSSDESSSNSSQVQKQSVQSGKPDEKSEGDGQKSRGGMTSGSMAPILPSSGGGLLYGKGEGQVDTRQFGPARDWGALPPKEREQILRQVDRKFPPHYRRLIEQYFREMAK